MLPCEVSQHLWCGDSRDQKASHGHCFLSPAAISCPPPPAIPNGKHNSSGTEEFTFSSVVMYTCDPGLQLVGNETLRNWSQPRPHCKGRFVICPPQQESLDRFPRGMTVHYSCQDGYAPIGNVSISCTEAGMWSWPLPRCEGGSRMHCEVWGWRKGCWMFWL
uniref:Uncharacterized protein n=1 Tax=Melopsittacus undulatus TaxID=13146 RepID=A0A8V5H8N5_MELUD